MKILLVVVAFLHFILCTCTAASTSSAQKVSSSPYKTAYTQMRDVRRKIGQATKVRNIRKAKYFRDKIIPLEDKDQRHRENSEWDYADHDPLPQNLDVHRGEDLSKTLIHKVKRTINNWADKLSKLQHDTRMRASQPQITEGSFQHPYAVKEEDSGLAMTHGEE